MSAIIVDLLCFGKIKLVLYGSLQPPSLSLRSCSEMFAFAVFPDRRAEIVAIFSEEGIRLEQLETNMEGCVLVDETNFYAEQGGQLSDSGILFSSSEVSATLGHIKECVFRLSDEREPSTRRFVMVLLIVLLLPSQPSTHFRYLLLFISTTTMLYSGNGSLDFKQPTS